MKKQPKNKLPLATQTVRALTRSLADDQIGAVAGGATTSLQTIILSRCIQSTICTG